MRLVSVTCVQGLEPGLEALESWSAARSLRLNKVLQRNNVSSEITELLRRFDAQGLRPPHVELVKGDLTQAAHRIPQTVDFLWLDPPYAHIPQWLEWSKEGLSHVKPGAWWIIEHPSKMSIDEKSLEGWELVKHKRYGNTEISILERQAL